MDLTWPSSPALFKWKIYMAMLSYSKNSYVCAGIAGRFICVAICDQYEFEGNTETNDQETYCISLHIHFLRITNTYNIQQ